ncbi:MAG: murein transglycosylase domain-containing protein [Desulfovibrionaceae bacterium]
MRLFTLILLAALAGCTAGEVIRSVKAAATGDPVAAAQIAGTRAARYAADPGALDRDLDKLKQTFETFRKIVSGSWGEDEAKAPSPKTYVKYTQNYESRASVDFDAGMVTVETVARKTPDESLKNAVVTTLLTPDDPRAVDLFSAQEVKLTGTPFLLGEVEDQHGRAIDSPARAEAFADYLVGARMRSKGIETPKGPRILRWVRFPLVPDHLQVRAQKYAPLVREQAAAFDVSPNLVFAVMKVESDFNPFAVSHAGAIGLMQVVPASAGGDVYAFLHGKPGRPSGEALMQPAVNIRYGAAYLHMLFDRYLAKVADPVSREYCVISAYNTGPGNLLRTFSSNREAAFRQINELDPLSVYRTLRSRLPYQETRRYLLKVLQAKKQFVRLS